RSVAGLHHGVDGSIQISEMSEWIGLLKIKMTRGRFILALESSGEDKGAAVALVDPTIEHGHRRLEAVPILKQEHRGIRSFRRGRAIIAGGMGRQQLDSCF